MEGVPLVNVETLPIRKQWGEMCLFKFQLFHHCKKELSYSVHHERSRTITLMELYRSKSTTSGINFLWFSKVVMVFLGFS